MGKRYIRATNNRGLLCEVTPELVAKLRTYKLLGKQEIMIQSPCVLNQELLITNQLFIARSDYQQGRFKCTATYHGDDSWLIRMWEV